MARPRPAPMPTPTAMFLAATPRAAPMPMPIATHAPTLALPLLGIWLLSRPTACGSAVSAPSHGHRGLHVARTGAGAPRRSPLGHLLVWRDPLRAVVGGKGVQAGHGERHDGGDHARRAAGARRVGTQRLACLGPH